VKYANLLGYSDTSPFEVLTVSKSGKQITLRGMSATRDPSWTPEWHSGGFSAHCANQESQRWLIEVCEDNPPIKAYRRADGYYWSAYGKHKLEDQPRKFYDYNF